MRGQQFRTRLVPWQGTFVIVAIVQPAERLREHRFTGRFLARDQASEQEARDRLGERRYGLLLGRVRAEHVHEVRTQPGLAAGDLILRAGAVGELELVRVHELGGVLLRSQEVCVDAALRCVDQHLLPCRILRDELCDACIEDRDTHPGAWPNKWLRVFMKR